MSTRSPESSLVGQRPLDSRWSTTWLEPSCRSAVDLWRCSASLCAAAGLSASSCLRTPKRSPSSI